MTDYAKWDRFAADIDGDSGSSSDDGEGEAGSRGAPRRGAGSGEAGGNASPRRTSEAGGVTSSGGVRSFSKQSAGDDGAAAALASSSASPLEFSLVAQKYAETLQLEEERLSELKQKRNSCVEVIDLLRSAPSKTRHKVMVPFGKAAFYEGEMRHTNEFLVKLDDTMLERTAEQTIEILERKMNVYNAEMDGLQKSISALHSSLSLTTEASRGGFIDIREEYTEDEPDYLQELAMPARQVWEGGSGDFISDEEYSDMMKRVEHLAMLEEEEMPGQEEVQASAGATHSGEDKTNKTTSARDKPANMPEKPLRGGSERAFSGLIVEKNTGLAKGSTGTPHRTKEEESKQSRPMSRFKMSKRH